MRCLVVTYERMDKEETPKEKLQERYWFPFWYSLERIEKYRTVGAVSFWIEKRGKKVSGEYFFYQ